MRERMETIEEVRARAGARGGFTIIEVVIAAMVVVVGLLGLLSAISSSLQLAVTSRETQIATSGIQREIETIRDAAVAVTPFSNILTTYGGATFTVPGLTLMPGQTAQGTVTFLSEPQAATALGLVAVDLNGNGNYTDTPDATFYTYVIRVDVSWQSEMGSTPAARNRTIEVVTSIAKTQ